MIFVNNFFVKIQQQFLYLKIMLRKAVNLAIWEKQLLQIWIVQFDSLNWYI